MSVRRLSDIILDQQLLMLPGTATVSSACRQMRDRRVGSVLVIAADGTLAGIFTGRDAVARVLAPGRSGRTTRLTEVMTPGPRTLESHKSAIEALRLMADGGFRHVPVVDGARVVGIVSRGDFKGMERDQLEEEQNLWEHMR